MKKVYLFLAAALFCASSLMAQTVTVPFVAEGPTIDGDMDELWEEANVTQQDITLALGTEDSDNTSYWKAVHDGEFIYVFVNVEDASNVLDPSFPTSAAPWEYDMVELYFDTQLEYNGPDDDGTNVGSQHGVPHYQFTVQAHDDDVSNSGDAGDFEVNVMMDGTNYSLEYKVAFATILTFDGDEILADGATEYGFDVTCVDRDEGAESRQRRAWTCGGEGVAEAWADMAGAGHIILAEAVGVSISKVAASAVNVYPNPAQGMVSVELENLNAVAIFNVAGQEVMNVNATSDKMDINISELNRGVYYIKATDNSGAVGTNKIVKQ